MTPEHDAIGGRVICPATLHVVGKEPAYLRTYLEWAARRGDTLLVSAASISGLLALVDDAHKDVLHRLTISGAFLIRPLEERDAAAVGAIAADLPGERDLTTLGIAHGVLEARRREWRVATTEPGRYRGVTGIALDDLP
ncbi:hypothetical protein HDA32_002526 [Spinactinospora alkalitolerans]|uniref:Uncharacterized protein n=1 Tax=Spinactinospora alkalitolerans TaxID=687207 RepID=A0A852TSL7_9ACTN|nr:hypothetical protein [Spinactinospora alkalitolerans]NYE47406.1 hypothetical protein [Spinactinospora alkalitolerans]